jgi:hypothetical protein
MNQPSVQIPPRSEVRSAAILAGVIVLVVATATTYYLVEHRPTAVDPTPRLDAPVDEIAKFVSNPEFLKLPFETQRRIMEVLDDREDDLDRAYLDGKLAAYEYQRAIEYGWFGKQLPRMEKYHSLGPAEQAAYIDERLDKKDDKDRNGKKGDGKDGGGGKSASADIDVKRDEQSEKDIPKSWPPEWRDKWKKYRQALKERREEREEQRQDAAQSSNQN